MMEIGGNTATGFLQGITGTNVAARLGSPGGVVAATRSAVSGGISAAARSAASAVGAVGIPRFSSSSTARPSLQPSSRTSLDSSR